MKNQNINEKYDSVCPNCGAKFNKDEEEPTCPCCGYVMDV
jgi:predicted amidophosphoribosyltransferase